MNIWNFEFKKQLRIGIKSDEASSQLLIAIIHWLLLAQTNVAMKECTNEAFSSIYARFNS